MQCGGANERERSEATLMAATTTFWVVRGGEREEKGKGWSERRRKEGKGRWEEREGVMYTYK